MVISYTSRRMMNGSTLIVTLVVLMLLIHPGRAGVYGCWGGCLNQCVLIADKKPEEKSTCYWNCLANCFPESGQISTHSSSASEIAGSPLPNTPPISINNKPTFPHFGLGKKYYCIIGCSLHSCLIHGHAGVDLKLCLIRCTHKCK
ncbi:unnamed protein product [Lactuca saligna]|uniref:Thionin-like protein 2 n=1 Tax=Lactuca saligna TaxID=75948 RepID=A0AA35ZAQ0_LACSI|nr:unnamed protein product [Lactuca saligna]